MDEVELLDVPSRSWLRIRKGHVITLTSNLHIFVRRRGVQCHDFNHHYNLFVKPPRTPNIRTDMRGERKFIASQPSAPPNSSSSSIKDLGSHPRPSKRRLKKVLPDIIISDISDSEVEVFNSPAPQPRERQIKKESAANTVNRSKKRLPHIVLSDSDIEVFDGPVPRMIKKEPRGDTVMRSKKKVPDVLLSDSEVEVFDGPAPQSHKCRGIKEEAADDMERLWKRPRHAQPMRTSQGSCAKPINIDEEQFSSTEQSVRSYSPALSSASSSPTTNQGPWPAGVFTCDMLDGFRSMDSHTMACDYPNINEHFEHIFSASYRHATYYDACRRLKAMNQHDIDLSVAALRSPNGLWSRLAKDIPLKKNY